MKLSAARTVSGTRDYVSERAEVQYVANCTRPDLCAALQLLVMQEEKIQPENVKALNKLIKRCNATSEVGLNYVTLDRNSLRIMLFTDDSFTNASNLKSQLGFVALLVNGDNSAHVPGAEVLHIESWLQ